MFNQPSICCCLLLLTASSTLQAVAVFVLLARVHRLFATHLRDTCHIFMVVISQ